MAQCKHHKFCKHDIKMVLYTLDASNATLNWTQYLMGGPVPSISTKGLKKPPALYRFSSAWINQKMSTWSLLGQQVIDIWIP